MRNVTNKPKHITSKILGILFAGILALTFTDSFSAIGQVEDWNYYNSYAQNITLATPSMASRVENPVYSGILYNYIDADNIAEASEENQELFYAAKKLIWANLGGYSSLLWEHFDNIEVKDCSLNGATSMFTLAEYCPEDNTVYCNRLVLLGSDEDTKLHTMVHELIHSLLERDRSAFLNNTGAFHEGFTEYLAQTVYPTQSISYYMNFCIAEVFVKDNGLYKAIELFMSGEAEESINRRLHKDNLVQKLNKPLYDSTLSLKDQDAVMAILDTYLHYAQVTGVDISDRINLAMMHVKPSFDNLAAMYYFDRLRNDLAATTNQSRLFLGTKNTRAFNSGILF